MCELSVQLELECEKSLQLEATNRQLRGLVAPLLPLQGFGFLLPWDEKDCRGRIAKWTDLVISVIYVN